MIGRLSLVLENLPIIYRVAIWYWQMHRLASPDNNMKLIPENTILANHIHIIRNVEENITLFYSYLIFLVLHLRRIAAQE